MTPAIMLAASGSGAGFDAVVHGIESRYHVHATHIPFLGLMSGIAGIATHGGVRGMHIAEMEHFNTAVDGTELNALVAQRAGKGWQRIIRETSHDGDEQSLIFVRPEGNRMGMLIVDLDHKEMDVVQISINPDQLSHEIESHHHGHGKDGDSPDKSDNDASDKSESE
jgi:hypothetical protein